MKAAVYYKYGGPEVVTIQELPKPVPKEDEILIKVHASTVNRTDAGFRSAEYFISRFWSGLIKPNVNVLGCEFAGEVIQTGLLVKDFKPGDRVFAFNDSKFGGHAEYVTVKESGMVATIPEGISYEIAASATEGSHYALGSIRAAGIKEGDNVLVYGATGAIGSAAVQILKHYKARVTAVCNTKNVELIKSLGADEVIDYQKEDFTITNQKFKFVLDAVGKISFGIAKPLMQKNACYISTELGKNGQNVYLAMFSFLMKGKKVLFPIPKSSKKDIEFLKKLLTDGEFKPVYDRTFDLKNIQEAYQYVDTGMKTGNVIIRITS